MTSHIPNVRTWLLLIAFVTAVCSSQSKTTRVPETARALADRSLKIALPEDSSRTSDELLSSYDAMCKLLVRGQALNPEFNRTGIETAASIIDAAELSCEPNGNVSQPGGEAAWPKVRIYVNSTYLGTFAKKFTGVELEHNRLACVNTSAFTIPIFPILAFCSNQNIILDKPRVGEIVLPTKLDYKPGSWESVVLLFDGNIYVDSGLVARNKVGTPVVIVGNGTLRLFNTTIALNEGAVLGGAVRVHHYANLVVTGESNIQNNTAGMGGGIADMGGGSILLGDSTYCTGNTALKAGGCMHLEGLVNATVGPDVHVGFNAAPGGGAFFLIDGASIDVYGLVRNNTAFSTRERDLYNHMVIQHNGGGMILQENAHAIFRKGSACIGNTADEYGGCVSCLGNSTVSFLPGSLCLANQAGSDGGCVMTYDEARAYLGGAFITNHANKSGGAFAAAADAHVDFDGCMAANAADWAGGGGDVTDQASLAMSGCAQGLGNQAVHRSGGGLALTTSGSAVIKDCAYFAYNSAKDIGGAVVVSGTDSHIVINGSDTRAECAKLCRTRLTDCMFGLTPEQHFTNLLRLSLNHTGVIFTKNQAKIGGGVWVSDGIFRMINAHVLYNEAGTAGGVCAQAGATLAASLNAYIVNSTMVGNVASWGGAMWVTENATVTLSGDTVITKNLAKSVVTLTAAGPTRGEGSGGGIAVTAGTLVLRDKAKITDNTAVLYGGGISGEVGAVVTMHDSSSIQNNTAKRGGGVAFTKWGGSFAVLDDASVSNNTADTANDMYLPPAKIALELPPAVTKATRLGPTGNTSVPVYPVTSRISREEGLMPLVVKISGYAALPSAGAYIRVSMDGKELLGGLKKTNESGMADFYDLKLRAPPGLYKIKFETLDIYETAPPATLLVSVRHCIPGEVTLGYPDACEPCLPGSYSLNPENITCDPCPEGAVCAGGSQIWPQPGWWHSAALSPQFHKCQNPGACVGAVVDPLCIAATGTDASHSMAMGTNRSTTNCYNITELQFSSPAGPANISTDALIIQGTNANPTQDLCAQGYSGNMCGACAPGWGSVAVFECKSCYPAATVIALYSLICLAMLLVVRVMAYFTLQENIRPLGAADDMRIADVFKSLVLWVQWLAVVASIRVDWPAALRYPFTILQWLWASPSAQTLSLDCVLQHNSHKVSIAVQRLVVYLGVPVATYLVLIAVAAFTRLMYNCGIVNLLRRSFNRGRAAMRRCPPPFSHICITYFLVAVFVFLPSLSRTVFSLFVCVHMDNPEFVPYAWTAKANGTFWASDVNRQCWSEAYKRLSLGLGLPCVFLLCIALPLGILGLLLRYRLELQKPGFRAVFGFLYANYKPRPAWCAMSWEAIVITQTNIISAISVFGPSLGNQYQAIVMNAALALFLIMLMLARPYKSDKLHSVRLLGMSALLLTSYMAITFTPATGGWGSSYAPPKAYGTAVAVILLVLNCAYVLYCLLLIGKAVDWSTVCAKLLRVFGCFRVCCKHGAAGGGVAMDVKHVGPPEHV